MYPDYLKHHGVLGMKWGIRRYQNKDGTLTAEGRMRNAKKKGYYDDNGSLTEKGRERQKRQWSKDADWFESNMDIADAVALEYMDSGKEDLSGLRDFMKKEMSEIKAPSGRVLDFITDQEGHLFLGLFDEYTNDEEKRKQLVV